MPDRGNGTWHSLQVCLPASAIVFHVQHHKPDAQTVFNLHTKLFKHDVASLVLA